MLTNPAGLVSCLEMRDSAQFGGVRGGLRPPHTCIIYVVYYKLGQNDKLAKKSGGKSATYPQGYPQFIHRGKITENSGIDRNFL